MLDEPAQRRITNLLTVGIVAHGIAQTIIYTVLAPIGRELGFVELQIGGVISGSALVFFFASRWWGRFSDRVGRKPVLLAGLGASALGSLVLAQLFDLGLVGAWLGIGLYLAICVTRAAQSSIMSAAVPAATAYIADITSARRRTAGMSRIGAAFSFASIVGPAIAGLLAGISLLLPVYFGAAIAATAVVLMWRLLPPSPVLQTHEVSRRLRFFDPRLIGLIMIGILVFLGFSVIQQTLAFRLQDTLGLDARATARHYGFMMMLSAVFSLFIQTVVVQRISAPPLALLRAGLPLMLAAMLALLVGANNLLLALAMALLGGAVGFAGPGFTAAISLAVEPSEQGAAAGIASSIPGLGFIFGPVVGTGLYQVQPELPYLVTALVLLPGCIHVFRMRA